MDYPVEASVVFRGMRWTRREMVIDDLFRSDSLTVCVVLYFVDRAQPFAYNYDNIIFTIHPDPERPQWRIYYFIVVVNQVIVGIKK